MAQYKHDRFVKFYLRELYDEIKGKIPAVAPLIAKENLEIDILFQRDLNSPAWTEQRLGLLDLVMAEKPIAIVEHYSHAFQKDDYRACVVRGFLYQYEHQEDLKGQEPFTWVISAVLSAPMTSDINPTPDPTWRESLGLDLVKPKQRSDPNDMRLREPILRSAKINNLGIVVIERLPLTPATVWLKILGEEKDCLAAYQMIKDLPNSPAKYATLRACAKFNSYIRSLPPEEISEEDMVFVRSTEEIDKLYSENYYDVLAKGRAEGEAKGKSETVKLVISSKLGSISPELANKIESLEIEELDALTVSLFSFQGLQEVNNWLDNPDSRTDGHNQT